MKAGKKLLPFVIVAVLFLLQGCTVVSSDSKQDVIKKLMDREAKRSVVKLFGATYDPKESKVITAKQMNEWISKNKIDVKKFPVNVQKAIGEESALALLVPKFIPIKNKKDKATTRAYNMGGIFLPLFQYDFGGWWIGGDQGCDAKCHKCDGCEGDGHMCDCRFICYPGDCRECQTCP